jgi:hypothetical protein
MNKNIQKPSESIEIDHNRNIHQHNTVPQYYYPQQIPFQSPQHVPFQPMQYLQTPQSHYMHVESAALNSHISPTSISPNCQYDGIKEILEILNFISNKFSKIEKQIDQIDKAFENSSNNASLQNVEQSVIPAFEPLSLKSLDDHLTNELKYWERNLSEIAGNFHEDCWYVMS